MLTQNVQTLRQDTHIPITIAEYERYKASPEYYDLLSITHVLLRIAVSDFMIRKFMIMNVLFGEVGNILQLQKRDFILTSEYEYPFYYILDEFKTKYRQINWKKSLLTLKYKPQCILDYQLNIDNDNELERYLEFLRISSNPMVVSFLNTSIDINKLIDFFENNYYEYRGDYIDQSKDILKSKLRSNRYDLDKIFIITPKPQPIKKDDAWDS